MKSLNEALLAIVLTLALGGVFYLFGNEPGDGSTGVTAPVEVDAEAAARGAVISSDTGCLSCHTTDGTPGTGPTWKGLSGSSRPLESGEVVIADDAYMTLAIVDPEAQIVAGFSPVMPTDFTQQLTDTDIADLVEYMKSLGS